MPRVKIDYVVSFSSEDPENPANNLLEWEVSKKKWLCNKGESSSSVVLQLNKAIKIESINIGAYHVASVEVLVGLSEKPNDPFQVLVPSCMLLSPAESRREAGAERVRSFSAEQLAAARAQRWDRVRVVCAQPYNRHCKYGLSFVHIHSPEGTGPSAVPHALDELASDEEEFRPGELFAQHSQRASTDAQIRQASMEAIKNNSDKSTKLLKTPINKTNNNDYRPRNNEVPSSNRKKENLMYTDDDKLPHAKIDQVVQRHNQQKEKEKTANHQKAGQNHDKEKTKLNNSTNDDKGNKTMEPQKRSDKTPTPQGNDSKDSGSQSSQKKRKRSDDTAVLAGVQFTLSGYENPQRAELRAAALALGARYEPGVTRACTHIVCAFANTPKLRAARAAGSRAAAVSGEWLRACRQRRRRLPWRWFAVEPKDKRAPPAGWQRPRADDDSEVDTDDEIERVLQQQEKKKRVKSPSHDDESDERKPTAPSRAPPEPRCDTDCDEPPPQAAEQKELPNFFDGSTFTIAEDLDPEYDRALLARYIRAYGGLVVEASEVLDSGAVQFHVCGGGARGGACAGGGACVPPEWVWRCHRLRARAPLSG